VLHYSEKKQSTEITAENKVQKKRLMHCDLPSLQHDKGAVYKNTRGKSEI